MSISTSDFTSRNNIITEMLDESGGMMMNFARKHNLEFEEVRQNAALIMLETWPKLPVGIKNAKAYLNRVVRTQLLHFKQSVIEELEVSLEYESSVTESSLADKLEAPMQTEDTTRVDHIIETVHNALRECEQEEQEYAVWAFGMHSHTPVAPARRRESLRRLKKDNPASRGKDVLRRSVFLLVGRNPQVQALLPA